MRRTGIILALSMVLPLALAGCGGGGGEVAAADEAKLKDAVAFITSTDGTPGLYVSGRNIVLNYATRPSTFADNARKAALDATKAVGGKQITVYVVDSADAQTAVPAAGKFYCSITANDGRMAGNNC